MSQLTIVLTDADADAERVLISLEEAFIKVMGRDRPGRIRCVGSTETLETCYRFGEDSSSAAYQQ